MVFNTTKRMRLAKGAALLGEQGQYIELPARPQPSRLVTILLTIARVLRIYRAKPIQTNWDVFFDPALLHYDQLNAGACEQIVSLEQAGWRILFLTSLPDTCFEVRKQQLLAAGLLKGEARGLICKPQAAQFLKTRHWKTLVIAGTRVHHHMHLSDLEYRLLPDLLEFFPWMARGLLEHYRSTRLLLVDDEADNLGSMSAVAPWFLTEISFTLLGSLAQGVTLSQAGESTNN